MWSLLSLLKLFSTKFTNLSVFLTWSRAPSNVCSAVRGWCFVVESICQLGSKKAKNKRRKKKHTTRHLVLMAFVVSSVYGQFLRSWTHEEINDSTRENKLLCSSRQSLFLNIWLLTPHPQKIYIYIYIYIYKLHWSSDSNTWHFSVIITTLRPCKTVHEIFHEAQWKRYWTLRACNPVVTHLSRYSFISSQFNCISCIIKSILNL